MFAIIFLWTPPHFWALAISYANDYASAGVPMLPVTHGVRHTTLEILVYALILFAIALVPAFIGMSGPLYLAVAALAGGRFVWYAWRLCKGELGLAMPMFRYSITYLALIFGALLIDHYR
jgi:protoheme IX farnesyltransferase